MNDGDVAFAAAPVAGEREERQAERRELDVER
jgi:hypothetical protein